MGKNEVRSDLQEGVAELQTGRSRSKRLQCFSLLGRTFIDARQVTGLGNVKDRQGPGLKDMLPGSGEEKAKEALLEAMNGRGWQELNSGG